MGGLIEKGGGGARRSNIMDYWKTKVLPKVKKVFGKNGTKKAAAAEACKNFDDSKVINPSIFNSSSISFIPILHFTLHIHMVCMYLITNRIEIPNHNNS